MQGININDTAFKFSEYATKVAGLMNTEKDDVTKTFKVSEERALLDRGSAFSKHGEPSPLEYLLQFALELGICPAKALADLGCPFEVLVHP